MKNKEFKIFFDGAIRPINPGGVMGIGGYIADENDDWVYSYTDWLDAHPTNTSNKAEAISAYHALCWLFDKYINDLDNITVKVYGDSSVVCKKMNKPGQVFFGEYAEVAENLYELSKNSFKNVSFIWIPREENVIANELSIQALCQNNFDLCD